MHIIQVYHSKVPVSLYGGMERVIEALCLGLIEEGHRVTLISYRGDYEIPRVNFLALDQFDSMGQALDRYHELIPDDADVVHFHVPLKEVTIKKPYLFTMHGNLRPDENPRDLPANTVFISKDHANRHGRELFVYNGLVVNEIPFNEISLEQRNYFSFLGRISLKRKGLHLAKKISKALKIPLWVGGGRGFSFGLTKYLGHVDNDQKYELLSNSKALLFPILWEEPFGLVMIEAMFSGIPIFALNRGSVAEVLGQEGGQKLFLRADNIEGLIKKIKEYSFEKNSPKEIRDYGKKYFSHKVMTQSYLEIYQQVKEGKVL